MKTLVNYINESLNNNLKKDIEERALGIIDYFNQEGVAGFDENDWADYIDGSKEPDYKQIVDEIVAEYGDDPKNKKAVAFLKDYDKNKDEINEIILNAATSYLNNY